MQATLSDIFVTLQSREKFVQVASVQLVFRWASEFPVLLGEFFFTKSSASTLVKFP